MPLTRSDFQQLADVRSAEAEALLAAGLWDGAYYLAGYAVECALKACVAKLTRAEDFPDKDRAYKAFTHKIDELVTLAELVGEREAAVRADPTGGFRDNWDEVKRCAEIARYERRTEAEARAIWNAITDPTHGVLPWIKSRW